MSGCPRATWNQHVCGNGIALEGLKVGFYHGCIDHGQPVAGLH